MRILIFSDVHGNLTALEAVVDAMAAHEAVDEVIFAGDAAFAGPRPDECVTLIRQVADQALVGNTEQWIFEPPDASVVADDKRREFLAATAAWTAERLSEENAAWLRALPFSHRVSPTGRAENDLLVVHANPHDTMGVIYPPVATQEQAYGEVRQTDEALAEMLRGVTAGAIAFGHIHYPNERRLGDLLLANISSVSMPQDGDRRAKYGLLTWDGEAWSVMLHRVAYEVEQEIAALREHRPPDWETSAKMLQQ